MPVDLLPSRAAPTVEPAAPPALTRRQYVPRFPSPDLLFAVRDYLPAQGRWEGAEGPVTRFTYAPGAVQVQRRSYARREKSAERHEPWATDRVIDGVLFRTAVKLGSRVGRVNELAAQLNITGKFPDKPTPRQQIREWSRKSRCNFTLAMCQLDYVGGIQRRPRKHSSCPAWCRCAGRQPTPAPALIRPGRVPVMVTLTYSGDWLAAAPDGPTSKRHLAAFFKAYERAWGEPLTCIWKLEFQRRSAPHYHLFMVTPKGKAHSGEGLGLRFRQWLSATWARIVNHPDPDERQRHLRAGTNIKREDGWRCSDPRKIAVYFLKHSMFAAKAYQHVVPDEWQEPGRGPGRFWGYRHLRRLVHGVEVNPDDGTAVARTIRRWAYAQDTTQQRTVIRARGGVPRQVYADVIGLAGLQYATERPVLARTSSGELRWESEPVPLAVKTRRVRRRVKRMRGGVGWVAVNDGASFAQRLGDWLAQRYESRRQQLLAESDIARRPTPEESERLARLRARWLYRPPP